MGGRDELVGYGTFEKKGLNVPQNPHTVFTTNPHPPITVILVEKEEGTSSRCTSLLDSPLHHQPGEAL